jgi:hypothetical protein
MSRPQWSHNVVPIMSFCVWISDLPVLPTCRLFVVLTRIILGAKYKLWSIHYATLFTLLLLPEFERTNFRSVQNSRLPYRLQFKFGGKGVKMGHGNLKGFWTELRHIQEYMDLLIPCWHILSFVNSRTSQKRANIVKEEKGNAVSHVFIFLLGGMEPSPLLVRPLLAYCTSPGWLWMSVEQ